MGRKRHSEGAPVGNDPVMMITTSLFVILLSFFILLNSLAVPDEKKKRTAIGSLNENFGVLSGGYSLLDGEGGKSGGDKASKIENLLDFSDLIKAGSERPQVRAEGTRTIVTLSGAALFEPSSYQLKSSASPVLDRLAKVISETAYPVEIAGCMSKSADGRSSISSRELSAFRALSVLKYFTEKRGVSPKLLTAYGWGDDNPAVSDKIPDAKTVNERMEITFSGPTEIERPEGAFTFKDFFFKVLERK